MSGLKFCEKKLSCWQRKRLKDSDFGIPELRAYPLIDPSHVEQAIRMFNHVDPVYESMLARNLNMAIKKFGLDIAVGDTNRFKKYYKENRDFADDASSMCVNVILDGKSVREAIDMFIP